MKILQTKKLAHKIRPSFTESLDIRWHRALVVQTSRRHNYN